MKYLIAGLGNSGSEYSDTRHNIGFNVVDALAKASTAVFSPGRYADVCIVKFKGRTLILIKPTTFMNLSGKAINYWMQAEKIKPENLLVITDDLALPFGTLRMKSKGSDGGHNGLKNIQATLGHAQYPRLRFGVGSEFARGKQVDYVLGKWSEEESNALPERLDQALKMVQAFTTIGIDRTMSGFNGK